MDCDEIETEATRNMKDTKHKIEKLNKEDIVSLDFIQDASNKKIVDKINEIIDYLNKE